MENHGEQLEITGIPLETTGNHWKPRGATGNHWKPLETTGNHGEHLETTGNHWKLLEILEFLERYLKPLRLFKPQSFKTSRNYRNPLKTLKTI